MPRQPLQLTAFVVQVYAILVALSVGLGVAVLSGRALRFSSDGFVGPRALLGWLPGPVFTAWGLLFLLYGLLLVAALSRRAGTAAGIVWCGVPLYLFFAYGLAWSVIQEPAVAGTGIVAYSCAGLLHGVTAVRFRRGPG
jgi:hypothetical protein